MEPFIHRLRVRYGDCDMQGVVFNAVYMAYLDDAVDVWLEQRLGADYLQRFEYQTKKATIEWAAPARAQDTVELRPVLARLGRSSFGVTASIDVGDRHLADAELVYVCVEPGGGRSAPIPNDIREALGPPAG